MPERYPYSAAPESVSLRKYVGRFIGTYIALAILVGLISVLFNLESISAISAVVVLASAQLAGYLFRKDCGRIPEISEKRRFALYGMGFSLLVSVVPFAYLIAIGEAETTNIVNTLGLLGLGAVLLISSGLAYFLSAYGFVQGAKLQAKAEAAKEKRAFK